MAFDTKPTILLLGCVGCLAIPFLGGITGNTRTGAVEPGLLEGQPVPRTSFEGELGLSIAQPKRNLPKIEIPSPEPEHSVFPTHRPDRGSPGATDGGGVRWSQGRPFFYEAPLPDQTAPRRTAPVPPPPRCPDEPNALHVTALLQPYWLAFPTPTTTLAQPSLFLYLASNQVTKAALTITHQERPFYKGTLSLPKQAGIVQIALPADRPLAAGETYGWTIELSCKVGGLKRVETLSGHLERVELPQEVQTQIDQAEGVQKAQLLADNGVWFDTLMLVAESYDKTPKIWQDFLESAGLEEIVQVPPPPRGQTKRHD